MIINDLLFLFARRLGAERSVAPLQHFHPIVAQEFPSLLLPHNTLRQTNTDLAAR
jgi:hypothetical protein